jgi:hypothetical protein
MLAVLACNPCEPGFGMMFSAIKQPTLRRQNLSTTVLHWCFGPSGASCGRRAFVLWTRFNDLNCASF